MTIKTKSEQAAYREGVRDGMGKARQIVWDHTFLKRIGGADVELCDKLEDVMERSTAIDAAMRKP